MKNEMTIQEIIDKNLYLPIELRELENQLALSSLLYPSKNKEIYDDYEFYIKHLSVHDFSDMFFNVYLKKMYSYGYKLSKMNIRQEYLPMPLSQILDNIKKLNYIEVAEHDNSTIDLFDLGTSEYDYSSNLDKYRKEFRYLPVEFRDFHDQKDLFRLLCSNTNYSPVIMQIFITDFFSHFLVYCGITLQKTNKKLPFNDIYKDIKSHKKGNLNNFINILSQSK